MSISPRFGRACATLLLLGLALEACDFNADPLVIEPEFDDISSFETDLWKWVARGVDITDPPVAWEVVRSGERATQGTQSVRLRLANLNDQGKVWIERRYEVADDQLYSVESSFDFASADWGDVNLWRILAGAGPVSPASGGPTPQGSTANGSASDEGHQWLPKVYTLEARSSADGQLFVHVGVWGMS